MIRQNRIAVTLLKQRSGDLRDPLKVPLFRNHLFSFAQGELALHKNLITCVIVGREKPVSVGNDTNETKAQAVCIKPGVPHRVIVHDGGAEIIYLDGVTLSGQRPDFSPLSAEWHGLRTAFQTQDNNALTTFRRMLMDAPTPVDPSVMRIVERLYQDPFDRLSQLDLAQDLQLERTLALRHFKATTGQTFRKFKIWAAIMCAVHAAHKGEKIGRAGIQAGFADAAHLTRTAADVFGITPTQGLSGLTGVISIAAP